MNVYDFITDDVQYKIKSNSRLSNHKNAFQFVLDEVNNITHTIFQTQKDKKGSGKGSSPQGISRHKHSASRTGAIIYTQNCLLGLLEDAFLFCPFFF
jgi:hypothetical protein